MNTSTSAENEYLSDGTDKPMRQIAEELGVASILEESVPQAGQRVWITAQRIDAASEEHLGGRLGRE